jgi:hypothetical protein
LGCRIIIDGDRVKNQPFAAVLAAALDDEDETLPCLACHL